jgi:WD40 repeat protein
VAGQFRRLTKRHADLLLCSAASQRGSQLLWVDEHGNTIHALGERTFIHDLTLSPDGRKLAVGAGDPSSDIWLYDTFDGKRSRLTSKA